MRKLLVGVACGLFLSAASATAETSIVGSTSGYTYFNRPGATDAQYQADLDACQRVMSQVQYNRRSTIMNPQASDFAVGSSILTDAIGNVLAIRRGYAANFENCMVVRGWRVVRLSAARGEELEAMAPAALREALAEAIGAETPPGDVVRAWRNDMQDATTTWTGDPGNLDEVSLSLRSAGLSTENLESRGPRPRDPNRPRSAFEPGQINARTAERQPPEQSLIVLSMDSNFRLAQTTLRFERIGPDPDQPAWVDDGLPAGINAQLGSLGGSSRQTFIFRVPPGRWRIASLTQRSGMAETLYITDFCLGSPSFEVGPGEAVYAGAFHLRTAAFGPDLNLAAIQAELSENAPTLAPRLRGAEYTNGSTRACAGTYIYALEAPDAPFAEGYALGSRANAPPAPAPSAAPTP